MCWMWCRNKNQCMDVSEVMCKMTFDQYFWVRWHCWLSSLIFTANCISIQFVWLCFKHINKLHIFVSRLQGCSYLFKMCMEKFLNLFISFRRYKLTKIYLDITQIIKSEKPKCIRGQDFIFQNSPCGPWSVFGVLSGQYTHLLKFSKLWELYY